MPKTVEESLLGDHSDQWMDSDCPEPKRLKVSYTYIAETLVLHGGGWFINAILACSDLL